MVNNASYPQTAMRLTGSFPARRKLTLISILSISLILLYTTTTLLLPTTPTPTPTPTQTKCDLTVGEWAHNPTPTPPLYSPTCPFHRNAWNCLRNARDNVDSIASLTWRPASCTLPRIRPDRFLRALSGKRIGFVGDSLNENFIVAFLCALRSADDGARKWKRKGAWRGGYFPKFDVIVAYHRAVLLAKYTRFGHSLRRPIDAPVRRSRKTIDTGASTVGLNERGLKL